MNQNPLELFHNDKVKILENFVSNEYFLNNVYHQMFMKDKEGVENNDKSLFPSTKLELKE